MTTIVNQLPLASFAVVFEKSQYLDEENHRIFESDWVQFHGVEFKIKLFPNEPLKNGMINPYISASFCARCAAGAQAHFKFGVKTWKFGEDECWFVDDESFENNAETELGKVQIEKRKSLINEQSEYLKNEKIYFVVQIKVLDCLKVVVPKPCIAEAWKNDIHSMLFDQATSDFSILTETARVPCHKVFLSLVSPVFKVMFENQMKESATNEIVISDFSEDIVRSFLRCIYDYSSIDNELTQNAEQLLMISDKYEVLYLSNYVSNYIIQQITAENVLDILLFASRYDKPDIKIGALNFMSRNACVFMKQAGLSEVLGHKLMSEYTCYVAEHYSFEPSGKRQK